ncbi:MAG TPA: serine hydroxymethyltransferase, partial [Thermoplasmata archaeon]
RIGMREAQMAEVATLMGRVAMKGEDPAKVAKDVAAMRRDFNTIHFCYQPGVEAHKRLRLFGA